MKNLEQYRLKMDELTKRLADRTHSNQKPTNYPPCFVSYSWVNSRQAVAKGTRYTVAGFFNNDLCCSWCSIALMTTKVVLHAMFYELLVVI